MATIGRPLGEEAKRRNVKETLEQAIPPQDKDNAIYISRLERYMAFYDNLIYVNSRITTLKQEDDPDDKMILSLIGEARRIENQLLEIEKYFGFKPSDEMTAGAMNAALV